MPYDLREALRPETERAAHELNAAYKLVLSARRWRARVTEIFRREGSSDSEFSALYHLAAAPAGLKQSELAERMGVSGPTLTRLLDGLEARARIHRGEIIGDKRSKLITLTAIGRDAVRELDPLARALREDIFTGCTDAEVIAFERMLDRILERSGTP
ncbi:MarR family winged helix-turn-helix transcriptional regulator [Brevundimonas sp. FT23042]|uniref:MarR family winged helix-turn-helix transcriptional regulator n=1 Tax=Brevundimonas sp. FT23042 TaxID=3393749 RepID=UPI003B58A050